MQKVVPRSKLRFPALYLQQLAIPHVKHGLGHARSSLRWGCARYRARTVRLVGRTVAFRLGSAPRCQIIFGPSSCSSVHSNALEAY